jgi:hypothetical protein
MRKIVRTDWKVYNPDGEYIAATKHPEEAAILVAALGDKTQIKYKHCIVVWTEGKEDQGAAASYQHVAQVCIDRVNQVRRQNFAATQQRQQAQRKAPGGNRS